MRLRTSLLAGILAALLLGLPSVTVSSTDSYRASSTSLRLLWAQDLAAGVDATQLAPLQSELDATDASTFAGLPTIVFKPAASQSLLSSLRFRTDAIYFADLASAKTEAAAARVQLQTASGPLTTVEAHVLREEFATAFTPSDFSALAVALRLDALLVPLDRSLSTRQVTLIGLIAQANSLSLATASAATNLNDLNAYFQLEPIIRYTLASGLTSRSDASIADLQARIVAELAKRAAAAKAAAEAKAADAAVAVAAGSTAPSQGGTRPATFIFSLSGNYDDCTYATVVPNGLFRDTCIIHTYYLVSHKSSTGGSFFALKVGSIIYFQGVRYTISSRSIVTPQAEKSVLLSEYWATNVAPLTLQTEWNDSGSLFLVLEARLS